MWEGRFGRGEFWNVRETHKINFPFILMINFTFGDFHPDNHATIGEGGIRELEKKQQQWFIIY